MEDNGLSHVSAPAKDVLIGCIALNFNGHDLIDIGRALIEAGKAKRGRAIITKTRVGTIILLPTAHIEAGYRDPWEPTPENNSEAAP